VPKNITCSVLVNSIIGPPDTILIKRNIGLQPMLNLIPADTGVALQKKDLIIK